MAVAVDFRRFEPVDSRADLLRKVQEAPAKHAEAILAAYEVLEKLHEKDVLSTLNGLLSAKDMVVDKVADVVSSKEMIKLLRLALMAGNLLKDIDPDEIRTALNQTASEPPSLVQIVKRIMSKDARRALGAAGSVLSVFGAAMRKQSPRS